MGIDLLPLVLLACIYFVPFVVALCRSHPQIWPIFWLNLLLGWMFIGWVAALVWAVVRFKKEK